MVIRPCPYTTCVVCVCAREYSCACFVYVHVCVCACVWVRVLCVHAGARSCAMTCLHERFLAYLLTDTVPFTRRCDLLGEAIDYLPAMESYPSCKTVSGSSGIVESVDCLNRA